MAVVMLLTPAAAFAQSKRDSDDRTSQSAARAQELAQLLESMQLTNVAAPNGDGYVGALYIPGRQLLVVAGKFSSDERMKYLLATKAYSDAYVDLNGATARDSRVLISDLGANGVLFDREKDQPFDYVDLAGKSVQFDGEWGRGKGISRDEYRETWQDTDTRYTQMLEALIATLKKSS
jgi:hypothetical protein